MQKISTFLDRIENGSITLPVFQRGYVWSRKQVRELFTSLYKGYPVGSLLIWETASSNTPTRGSIPSHTTPLQLLLDGQQRMTSLYGVMRGHKPDFFDGNATAFTGLMFHIEDETFEFLQPVRMKDDPKWIDVTNLFLSGTQGVEPLIDDLKAQGFNTSGYMGRLLTLLDISKRELHVELVTGDDKTGETVVDIFNQVNSGGTKLTQGDLALANICARWSDAREEMQLRLAKWEAKDYNFELDWLLRVINTITTGEAMFQYLHKMDPDTFEDGLQRAEKYIDKALNIISSRIGLDHDQVLFSKPAIAIFVAFLDKNQGNISPEQRDKLLYWYVHTGMWGWYSGSPESTLNKDLGTIQDTESPEDPIDRLIEMVRLGRGTLTLESQHFHGWGRGSRFYSVLYMITRIGQARDFHSGLPLKKHQLGKMSELELHHIFPKYQLYEAGYSKQEINALANFCFLLKEADDSISGRLPSDYFLEIESKHPGALESQWIPSDPSLWEVDRYADFLEARKELLANATNEILNSLLTDHTDVSSEIDDRETISVPQATSVSRRPASIKDDEEEAMLVEINEWIKEQGLQPGIMGYELVHPIDGESLAMFDLAWPEGVQSELSEPVALLIDEDIEILIVAGSYGYRFFTSTRDFKKYITDEILMTSSTVSSAESEIQDLITGGETETVEFKSALRANLHTGENDKRIENAVLKTIAGFLNTKGGTLLIGVADDGSSVGIQTDGFSSEDRMNLHLVNLVKSRMMAQTMTMVHIYFEDFQENRIMKVVCDPSHTPVYLKENNEERFYVRMGASTDHLPPSQIPSYTKSRFEQ